MKVSFSIGSKSMAVINTLKASADNIDFFTFNSMSEMIREATLRHISFDRIVFSSEILNKSNPESDLRKLNDFISNYSNQTELVFIIKGKVDNDKGLDKVFYSMFNSPMYTPVIMDRANPQRLLEIVKDDITNLKSKYYELQDNKDRVVVSGNSDNATEKSINKPVAEKKKGLFSSIFSGQSKKEALLKEMEEQKKRELNQSTNIENIGVNRMVEDMGSNVFKDTGDAISSPINNTTSEFEDTNIFDTRNEIPASNEYEDNYADFSSTTDEEEMLSIGKFGETHSDTGFLDSEEEEELKKFFNNKESSNITKNNDKSETIENVEVGEITEEGNILDSSNTTFKEKEIFKKSKDSESNVDLIISCKGTGATQEIVDEAVRLSDNEGLKVLIIDLDLKENSILSYIDTERFYMEGANDGISKMRVYTEDGVDVASNGYGVPVGSRTLLNFLSSRLVKKYERIFIDCPVNSLNIFDSNMISMCNILIMSGSDRSDLISTTLALTNRSVVCYDVERYIADNCYIGFIGGNCSKEDIDWVNKVCLFANGNWLSRVDA